VIVPLALEEANAARAWGMPFHEWYMAPRWARAAMLASLRAQRRLEFWLAKWRAT